MNRRSFFKTITGFAAGVYAVFVPSKAKSDVIIFPTEEKAREFSQKRIEPIEGAVRRKGTIYPPEPQKRYGTEFICKARCDCKEQRLLNVNSSSERIMVLCPYHPPYWVNSDGTKESVNYYPRAIDIKERFPQWTKSQELP